MSNVCDICAKKKQIGRQSRHHKGVAGKQWAKRAPKTLRVYKPNLQWATFDGLRMKLCTKCLKLIRKGQKEAILAKEAQTVGTPVQTA